MPDLPKIAVLLETRRAFDRQLLHGISRYARLHGPWSFHVESDRLEDLKLPANLWNCAGMITRLTSPQLVKAVNGRNVPVLLVDGFDDPLAEQLENLIADVHADSQGVARLAAEYFSSRRFERFAFIGARDRDSSNLRCHSFGDVVRRTGHPLFVYSMLEASNRPWVEERAALAKWLEELPKPIGVMACDDERGLQVLEACRLARIAVPDQVAVLGVGTDELNREVADPPLSSVALNAVHGGYQAAHVLDQFLRRERQSHQRLVVEPTNIVVRASTDIDASQDPHVNAARSIIRRDFSRSFSIDALAKAVGVSRRVLEVKFRKHTRRTIWEEVQILRINRAKMILKETELPISEVATLSGYQSASHLVQLFARETGLTPAKYRIAARVPQTNAHSNWALGDLGRSTA
jgi:LacI family transcriptional regulator